MPSSSFQNIAPILFFLISPLSALNTVNIPSDVSEPTNSSYSYTNASCTSLLTHANATSSRSFPSRFLGGFDDNSTFPSKTFLLTAAVNEVVNNATNSTGVDTTIWFGTHPDSDLAQDGLSFAACAIIIDGLPLDGIKRGQADDGFCEQTFSDSCINELVERVTGIAIGLAQYAVPGEDGNRTSAMYPDICENIASQLSDKDNVPPACQEFKDEGSGKLWFNYETERMSSCSTKFSHILSPTFSYAMLNHSPSLQRSQALTTLPPSRPAAWPTPLLRTSSTHSTTN